MATEKRINLKSDNLDGKSSLPKSDKLSQSESIIKRPVGRPSHYTRAKGEKFCALVSGGKSLSAAAKEMSLNRSLVYSWLAEKEEFLRLYSVAVMQRADFLFDELDELEERAINNEINATAFRAVLDKRKWQLARMSPKKYGETAKIELSGSIDIACELERRLKGFAEPTGDSHEQ